jgi:uncharacterized protein (TIGR00369 family)
MERTEKLTDRDETGHFGEVIGIEHKPAPEDMAVLEIPLGTRLCNRNGTIHGGVIMTLMDAAGLWAGAPADGSPPRAATVSVTCNFLRGAQLKDVDTLRATAHVVKRGRALYFSSISVQAGADGPIIASGQGIYSHSTK